MARAQPAVSTSVLTALAVGAIGLLVAGVVGAAVHHPDAPGAGQVAAAGSGHGSSSAAKPASSKTKAATTVPVRPVLASALAATRKLGSAHYQFDLTSAGPTRAHSSVAGTVSFADQSGHGTVINHVERAGQPAIDEHHDEIFVGPDDYDRLSPADQARSNRAWIRSRPTAAPPPGETADTNPFIDLGMLDSATTVSPLPPGQPVPGPPTVSFQATIDLVAAQTRGAPVSRRLATSMVGYGDRTLAVTVVVGATDSVIRRVSWVVKRQDKTIPGAAGLNTVTMVLAFSGYAAAAAPTAPPPAADVLVQ